MNRKKTNNKNNHQKSTNSYQQKIKKNPPTPIIKAEGEKTAYKLTSTIRREERTHENRRNNKVKESFQKRVDKIFDDDEEACC